MTLPSTAEVMEALERMRRRLEPLLQDCRDTAAALNVPHRGIPLLQAELQAISILEKYAPELVERERKEREGVRVVRVEFTPEEARGLDAHLARPDGLMARGVVADSWDKLEAALKALDPPEPPERPDGEDGS